MRHRFSWPFVGPARGLRLIGALVFFVSLTGAFPGGAPVKALAAEKKPTTFLGVKVKPHHGTYLVLKDVNVRARPKTKSKRVGSFKTGQRIKVVGRAAGAWVAVRKGGKDQGFVYDKVLLPLIDGTLFKDLEGKASVKDGANCDFIIHFESKGPVEGQVFEIADYDVLWDCDWGNQKVKFLTPMFITEAPYLMGQKRIYQINIDILDLEGGYEEIFSTIFLYDQDKGLVSFDGVSIEKYGHPPEPKEASVGSVAEALMASVKMGLTAWNKAAWKDLIKNVP
ncbi:MAG: SH3 domain-containing protein [Rhodospirillales bacterium]